MMYAPISMTVRRWQPRELRFLGALLLVALVIGLYLDEGLSRAARDGAGHRVIDTRALQRRIDAGELSDREAQWYRQARPDPGSDAQPGTRP